jgi:dTDP-glucose pyrophosphorylase
MKKRDHHSILVGTSATIEDTIRVMDAGAMALALVVDGEGRLLGTVTDGDVRRGLLRGLRLADPVERVMHAGPVTAPPGTPRDELLRIMRHREIGQLPLVDDQGRVVGLELLGDLIAQPGVKDSPVLILAGGLGTRLRPLTADTPKPLLTVGNRPLLEVLIEQIAGYGFRNFFLAVNYRAEQVEASLKDGRRLGVSIRYLRETKPLGTAGAIRLARPDLTLPFLVVNGDLLTKANFDHLLAHHVSEGCDLTVAIKEYTQRIPYGVVRLEGGIVVAMEEKPVQACFVNAGMYVLDPGVTSLVPEQGSFDMPDLIRTVLDRGGRVGGFPILEYWLDIGAHEDYERANGEYHQHFGGTQDEPGSDAGPGDWRRGLHRPPPV